MARIGFWLMVMVFCPLVGRGQTITGRAGVVAVLGHPVTRLGVFGELAATGDMWQVFGGMGVFYDFRQYGPPGGGWELQGRLGFGLGFGPPGGQEGGIPRRYSAGYALNAYLDRMKTSQFTGTFRFAGGPVFMEMENDAFSIIKPGDQFRTGAFRIMYFRGDWQMEGRVVMWTGQTKGIAGLKMPSYPCRWGFRDISDGLYGRYSNGVAMLAVHYALPWGQRAFAGIGVDAEQVRHFFQNRLLHDLRFFPARWTPVRNPHYPMLDIAGCPYLYLEGQEVRRPRLVWQAGVEMDGVY